MSKRYGDTWHEGTFRVVKIHKDTWHMKAKCQGVIMHESIVVDKLAWVTHGIENARCQVDCMRCYTPRPNQFSGDRREKGEKRGKEEKERKNKRKWRRNQYQCTSGCRTGKFFEQGVKFVYALRGRGSLLLWLFFV